MFNDFALHIGRPKGKHVGIVFLENAEVRSKLVVIIRITNSYSSEILQVMK
jgi:hypothetical protein